MMKLTFLQQPDYVPIAYLPNEVGSRTFMVTENIQVELSNGMTIIIQQGSRTDLASIPGWAWSIMKPFDKAFIGDLIHDWLWINKIDQIKQFNGSIHEARKFADNERKIWRLKVAPDLILKTYITHFIIRTIGSFFYTRELNIPN